MFPPIPSWDGLHPLIIHFPIALFLAAPLLIIAAILVSRHRQGLMIGAFILMLIGSLSTFIAVSTGEAAGELAERTPAVNAAIEQHEKLAELTRTIFTVLTVIFAAVIFGPKMLKKNFAGASYVITVLAFLLFYSGGTLLLANTAHQGGRLVHEFGVRAMMATTESGFPDASGNLKIEQEKD